jgi:hypothetical protein
MFLKKGGVFMRKISFILLFMMIVFTGCANTKNETKDFSSTFGLPGYIIVYNKVAETKLEKNSEKYNKVIEILNDNFKKEKNISLIESKIKNNENLLKQNETSLEFVYYELSSYPLDAKDESSKKPFIKLLWTLTGENNTIFELGLNSGFVPYGSGAVGNFSKDLPTKVLDIVK